MLIQTKVKIDSSINRNWSKISVTGIKNSWTRYQYLGRYWDLDPISGNLYYPGETRAVGRLEFFPSYTFACSQVIWNLDYRMPRNSDLIPRNSDLMPQNSDLFNLTETKSKIKPPKLKLKAQIKPKIKVV